MLKAITVKNYALIDNLSITFDPGFSVITGETGAGKSIIIGALTLILGKRAESGVLKDPSKKCVIEGEFDVVSLGLENFFQENDLDYDQTIYLRREILPSGKSRAFINDTPVNLNLLKELGNRLIDIHSQHQTLQLADNHFQLETLDSFLKLQKEKTHYYNLFVQFKQLKKNLEKLMDEEAASKRDEDYLQFQLEEFEKVNLNQEYFQKAEERFNLLNHAGEVAQVLSETSSALLDNENSVVDTISELMIKLNGISEYFPKANDYIKRLESVKWELKDMAEEAANLLNDTEFNPQEMSSLETYLDQIYRLQQKHGVNTIEALRKIRDEFESRLQNINNLDERINELKINLEKIEKDLETQSGVLSKRRQEGKDRFAETIKKSLEKLGMKDAAFEVQILPSEDFTESGKDQVAFLFNANQGMKPDEIAKIASGGELSRLMLAIKSLITENRLLPTVIFDEIDTGVSGDIAGKVGNMMKEMAQHHQLLVITHLPQIAAKADHHYKVFKITQEHTTSTQIVKLDQQKRILEIAAMLSDDTITDAAKKAAMELLN